MRVSSLPLLALSLVLFTAAQAAAQSGVSDDRVNLPDGPGSRDGVGDNAALDENMGLVSYGVPFELPDGYASVTPSLGLGYSSGGGTSLVGIGWSFSMPSIERYTAKGLPSYDADDLISVGSSGELVRVAAPAADLAFYRARFEGGFTRYAWHDVGDGTEGYWTAEAPDGTTSYFGATSAGVLVPSARLGGAEGTFRWMLTEVVDLRGHRAVYRYDDQGGSVPLIDAIEYAFEDNTNATGARARITFDYELRPDLISDARGGFEELTAHRLVGVNVLSNGTRARRYEMTYEDYDTAGGLSRLARVVMKGTDTTEDPNHHAFSYSQGLGGTCSGESCSDPELVQMGSLGINLQSGTATLIDLNGDGVPDVLEAAAGETHRIFLSALDEDGAHTFASPVNSGLVGTSSHSLSSPYVQELDVNGDGFVDLLNAQSGDALINLGTGDWTSIETLGGSGTTTLPDFGSDLGKVRFLDYDLDRKIDVMRADATGTTIYRNLGNNGFEVDPSVADVGAGFEEDGLQLADMNGDGLLDPVRLLVGSVEFKINLGRGQFSEWRTIDNAPIATEDLAFTSLEDLNGDGIEDIVIVRADQVEYALNRNSESFEETAILSDAGGQALPTRDGTTTVLFADMNANGSDDVVWIDSSGAVTYLELFPIRPNLITHIENGVGMNLDIAYTSTALMRARNPLAWQHGTPGPMLVVDNLDVYAALDDISLEQHNLRTFDYQNAYYDSVEKQFRGFEIVIANLVGDDTQEALTTRTIYDLGLTSPARAGRFLAREWYGESARLSRNSLTWEACALAGVPNNLTPPIEWICNTEATTIVEEGAADADHVTKHQSFEYDGYGNRVVTRDEGVVGRGPTGDGACAPCERDADVGGAPCGAQCVGDEITTEVDYVPPSATGTAIGGWLLGLPSEERSSTGLGRTQTSRNYYDGEAFVGLPLGQATRGELTRQEQLLEDGDALQVSRARFDAHGNVVEMLTANAVVEGEDARQLAFYDALGLDLLAEERTVSRTVDGQSELVRLRREFTYDAIFDAPASKSTWFLADEPATKGVTQFRYDALGRPRAVIRPGDSEAAPTSEFEYDYGPIFTRYIERERSTTGGPLDNVEVECLDGLGRVLESKSRVTDTRWLSSGLTVFNARGEVVVESDMYESNTDACTAVLPGATQVSTTRFDALGRGIEVTEQDADERGEASTTLRTYLPLRVVERDQEAAAENGPPTATIDYDGQGRIVRVARGTNDTSTFVDVLYDDLAELRGFKDALGNERVQVRDLAGRILTATDPDRGTTTFEYDDEDNIIREVLANGKATRRTYDALGRKTAEWDEADEAASKMTYLWDRHPDCPAQSCDNGATRLVGHTYPLAEFGQGEDSWGYDLRGRPTEATRQLLGATFRLEGSFDNLDRIREQVYPGGRVVSWEYDALGRVTSIPGVVDEVTFDARGPLASMRFSNGVTTEVEHDLRVRLKSLRATTDAGTVLDLTITRDRLGNPTEIVDAAATGRVSGSARFRYDDLSRLVEAVLDPAGDNETISYRYDAIERLVEKTSSLTDSSENIGALQFDGTSHRVTQAGREIVRDSAGLAIEVGDLTLGYDHKARLNRVEKDGAEVARYFTTGSGFRVLKVAGGSLELTPFPGYQVRDGVSRLLLDLDGAPIFEEESAAVITQVLPDQNNDAAISSADAWLARRDDVAATLLRAAARQMLFADGDDDDDTARAFLHGDHIGSTVAVTDSEGEVKERISYTPYGGVRGSSAVHTEYASFAAKEIDEESGFINFGARALDPVQGAFLTPDPAGTQLVDQLDGQVPNVATSYNYARNSPGLFTDEGGATPSPGWQKFSKVMFGIGVVATVASAAVAIAALSMGTMGVANAIGAAVGFAVALGSEVTNQVLQAREKLKADGKPVNFKSVMKQIGWKGAAKIAYSSVRGLVSGALSCGVSSVFTAAGGVVDGLETTKKITPKTANISRVVIAAASIGTGGALYNTFASNIEGIDIPAITFDALGTTLEPVEKGAASVTTDDSSRMKKKYKNAKAKVGAAKRTVGAKMKTKVLKLLLKQRGQKKITR